MEHAGDDGGVGMAFEEGVAEVRSVARAAGGDDGDANGIGDEARDLELEAGARAVGVHGVDDDFAGAFAFGAPVSEPDIF